MGAETKNAVKAALEVPQVWAPDEIAAMDRAYNANVSRRGHYETLMAVGAALLRTRQKNLGLLEEMEAERKAKIGE